MSLFSMRDKDVLGAFIVLFRYSRCLCVHSMLQLFEIRCRYDMHCMYQVFAVILLSFGPVMRLGGS